MDTPDGNTSDQPTPDSQPAADARDQRRQELREEAGDRSMRQEAPYPVALERLVDAMAYRPGWAFYLEHTDRGQGSEGLTFIVRSQGYDTYHPDRGETYRVLHYFIVPAASYNEESWKAWILQRLIEVETHEACEFLRFDENRVFAPHHGPGWDPYTVFIHGDDEAVRTSYKGEVQA